MGTLTTVFKQKDLNFIKGLFEAGQLKSVIDKRFSLSQAADALQAYESRHTRGKVVVTIKEN